MKIHPVGAVDRGWTWWSYYFAVCFTE